MKIVKQEEHIKGGLFGLFGKWITLYTYVEDPFDPWSPEMAVIAAKVLREEGGYSTKEAIKTAAAVCFAGHMAEPQRETEEAIWE